MNERIQTITTIVPTIGRNSLTHTLDSLYPQVRSGDNVEVVLDGPADLHMSEEEVESLVHKYDRYSDAHWGLSRTNLGNWGHGARNHILDRGVDTDLVWTVDDDDVATQEALKWMRVQTSPWAIYKMHFGDGHPARGITCWREERLRFGDIGTPMIAARPGNARFGLRYEGDWDYAQALQDEYGDPTFLTMIIAHIRPELTHPSIF